MVEAVVKDNIKRILRRYGVYFIMPHGGHFGNIGVPDFICCYQGKFIAIEAKSSTGKVSPRQQVHLDDITEHGGIAMVVNDETLNDLEDLFKSKLEAN